MGLPWARVDCDIASHPKMLALCKSGRGREAGLVYVFGLCWAVSQGTDGHIPHAALPFIHGSQAHANLLVAHQLWETNGGGWLIHNFGQRQQLEDITQVKALRSAKGNCVRWHGQTCGCWRRLTVVGSS